MMGQEGNPYHLLYIEDNPLDVELVLERLRRSGHHFDAVIASSRAEFEQHFQANNFDLVLADYALPDFDGLSALAMVRARDEHLPFIFVSGVLGEDVAVDTLHRGATDYVLKQKLDRLAPAIQRALAEYATFCSREKAEHDLRKVEERFEKLTNSLPAMVWTSDQEGRLTYTNLLWKQCMGEAAFWLEERHIHPSDYDHCLQVWEGARQQSRPFEMECRFRLAPALHYHWHIVRALPLAVNGHHQEWLGTCIDIQEQKSRDAELKTAERLALIGRMSSVIAHEINNPLEALTNILYLVNSDKTSPEEAKAYLADAQHELLRISAITKQTLVWSREESAPVEVSAVTLMEEALKLFTGKLRNKGLAVHKHFRGTPRIHAVPGEIRQVLVNLISNAIDATRPGGNIHLAVEQPAGSSYVEFHVHDDGHGIENARMEDLFRPFQTTKGNLGNGLGLYVSKGIVDRHHGELKILSQPGHGTRAVMRIPCAA
ncbi:ATP-binding protein [Pseudacidobacterium ailaaui]|jgi:PAS domain S-box-containing protein|uniref:ATP-binding protein n=1 Tax=Pseudacidobacterium ailaaui TaxID=1382359 RepID=UPI0009DCDBD6|nr:ATP-binding protein [Pseudacidobacterium ailaaui]MCL6463143.1 response regulator [Pseudacidobacterium ailaaui]MDI3255280.1 ATP-binding protein [Bacillota bacterium]